MKKGPEKEDSGPCTKPNSEEYSMATPVFWTLIYKQALIPVKEAAAYPAGGES